VSDISILCTDRLLKPILGPGELEIEGVTVNEGVGVTVIPIDNEGDTEGVTDIVGVGDFTGVLEGVGEGVVTG
jgi:hypothetical protein